MSLSVTVTLPFICTREHCFLYPHFPGMEHVAWSMEHGACTNKPEADVYPLQFSCTRASCVHLNQIPPFTVSPPFQFVFHCLLSAPRRKYSQHCLQADQCADRLEIRGGDIQEAA